MVEEATLRDPIPFYNSGDRSRDIMLIGGFGGPVLALVFFLVGKPEIGLPCLIVGPLAAAGAWLSKSTYTKQGPWITVGPNGLWYRRDEHLFPWSGMKSVRFARISGKYASTLLELELHEPVDLPKRLGPVKSIEIDLQHLAVPLESVIEAVERFAPTLPRNIHLQSPDNRKLG